MVKSVLGKVMQEHIFDVSSKIFKLEPVLNTLYHFSNRYYCFIDVDDKEGKYKILLKPKDKNDRSELPEGEFLNELIKFQIRYMLTRRYEKTRIMYLQQAAFVQEVPGITQEEEGMNFEEEIEDFEEIALPWEEKYGKNLEEFVKDEKETESKKGSSRNEKD